MSAFCEKSSQLKDLNVRKFANGLSVSVHLYIYFFPKVIKLLASAL